MGTKSGVSFAACLLTLLGPAAAWPDGNKNELARKLLRNAGIGEERPALVAYLQRQSANDGDLARAEGLIADFGHANFQSRTKASQQVLAMGPAVLPHLRIAASDISLEVAQRARMCLRQLEDRYSWVEQRAAVLVLLGIGDAPSAEALVRFLPSTADEQAEEDIWFGLHHLAKKDAGLLHMLGGFLADAMPKRRALAGCLLARLGDARQRHSALPLLKDPHPLVRLRTAQGFLGARDDSGVGVLIELLLEPNVELCWPAEELLVWLAADTCPADTVGAAGFEARNRARKAWMNWWAKQRGKIDTAYWRRLEEGPRRPGLLLICDRAEEDQDRPLYRRVWLCGCDAKPRWQFEVRCKDAQLLPGNRVLLAEPQVLLVERDLAGDIAKRVATGRVAFDVWRLPNGNIQINSSSQVGADGSHLEVKTAERDIVECLGEELLNNSPRLPNGNILQSSYRADEWRPAPDDPKSRILHSHLETSPCVKEVRPDGTIVWAAATDGVMSRLRPCLQLVRLGFGDAPRKRHDITHLLLPWVTNPKRWVRVDVLKALRDPAPEMTAKVAAAALEACADPDPHVQGAAEETVKVLGPKAAHVFLKGVNDPRELVHRAAYSGLVTCKKQASPELRRQLVAFFIKQLEHPRPEMRWRAVNALGHFGPRSGLEDLVGRILVALLGDQDRIVRNSALRSMEFSGIAAETCVPVLIDNLKKKAGLEWRIWLTITLRGYLDHPEVFPFLVSLLSDEQWPIRDCAAWNISRLGKRGRPAIPAMMRAINDRDKNGRPLAGAGMIEALLELRADPTQSARILETLMLDKRCERALRASAAKGLGRLGEAARASLPALCEAAKEGTPYLSEYAATVIKNLGP